MDMLRIYKLDHPVGQLITRGTVSDGNNLKKVGVSDRIFFSSTMTADNESNIIYSRDRLYWAHKALYK